MIVKVTEFSCDTCRDLEICGGRHKREIASYSLDSVGIRQLLFKIEALVHTSLSSMNVAQVKRRVIYESKR